MDAAASRFNGKLKKWNAERGVGFVVADHGEQELFVHVSAFPRGGRPPVIGERAVRVRRPSDLPPRNSRHQAQAPTQGSPRRAPERTGSGSFASVLGEMDGDNDGIPCEQQLCSGAFGGG